jgi:hypothetical protein
MTDKPNTLTFTYTSSFLGELLMALEIASEQRDLYDAKELSILIVKNSRGNFHAQVVYTPDPYVEE